MVLLVVSRACSLAVSFQNYPYFRRGIDQMLTPFPALVIYERNQTRKGETYGGHKVLVLNLLLAGESLAKVMTYLSQFIHLTDEKR